MSFRLAGFVPVLVLLAAGVAHGQGVSPNNATMGGGGGSAYPDPLPSGQFRVPAPTARDVGREIYPSGAGNLPTVAPAPAK